MRFTFIVTLAAAMTSMASAQYDGLYESDAALYERGIEAADHLAHLESLVRRSAEIDPYGEDIVLQRRMSDVFVRLSDSGSPPEQLH